MMSMRPMSIISSPRRFLDFVNSTGSPFHSVQAAVALLEGAGFQRLTENNFVASLRNRKCSRFYITRNYTSIMAFVIGSQFKVDDGGFVIACAHTDSPALRIRPNSQMTSENYCLVGVETYGGGLWHTWFDRGLGIAGKVVVSTETSVLEEKLVRIMKPLLIIPNLAIHLQSTEERQVFKINNEMNLRPVLCAETKSDVKGAETKEKIVQDECLKTILASELGCDIRNIVDWDLFLMDATESRLAGLKEDLIESPRIDNLASVWAIFDGISSAVDVLEKGEDIAVAVAFDHEEVGSESLTGADSSLLESWLIQILHGLAPEPVSPLINPIMARSFLLSVDGAHGVHPNYADKHQAQHKPMLNGGVVLKENANQRYCSHASSMALIRECALSCSFLCPIQNMVVRNDSPCGTTIGPILSSRLGIRGVDIGISQWAMHSIRETCGALDLDHLQNLILSAYDKFRSIDERFTQL